MALITFDLAKGRLGNKIVKMLNDLNITDLVIDEDMGNIVIYSNDS